MDAKQALAIARQTLALEADSLKALSNALDESFWIAARQIAECPGILWVTGVGTSAAVGLRFAHVLTDCGVRSMFLAPDLGLHGHSGAMASGEVLVAISRGGESNEVNQMIEIANGLGVATLALVGSPTSTLARIARCCVPVPTRDEHELGGYAATTSSLAASAVCDAIAAVALQMTGYSQDRFRRTHPGGAVGRAHFQGPDQHGENR
jgi:D-arabinose 5-phosphate isomerase GutQ